MWAVQEERKTFSEILLQRVQYLKISFVVNCLKTGGEGIIFHVKSSSWVLKVLQWMKNIFWEP